MSSTQDPLYERFDPNIETHDTGDAHILLVHVPDFTRQQVGAYHEAAYKRIRVFGERPIENNKRIRFSREYTIPEDYDAEKLKGQFQDGGIITITIPKKSQEPQPESLPELPEPGSEWEPESEAEAESEPESEAEAESEPETEAEAEAEAESEPETEAESEPETEAEAEPETEAEAEAESEPETEAEAESEPEAEAEAEAESEPETEAEAESEPEAEQEEAKQVTAAPPKKSASKVESEAADMKNGEKGVSEEKPRSEMESSQREPDVKKDEKPTPPPEQEVTKEFLLTQRDTTQEDQKNRGTTEKEKGSESGIPQKNQDQEGKGIPQEDDKNDKNQKKIYEDGNASLQKDQFLAREKSKESERNESDLFIAYKSAGPKKSPERREEEGLVQKDQCLEREKSKDEIKISAKGIAAESYDIGLKKTSEEEEKKHMGVQTDKVNEERSHENTVSSESSSKGATKNMANSASEAVTRLANRFSEEDTQKKLLCAGAAILVVAVGIYASFKLRSMTRQ